MKLIPLVSIRVLREGQSVSPALGKAFDFTAEEKADLDRIHAEHNVESYRLPVNEVVAEVVEPVTLTAAEKKAAKKAADEGTEAL